MRHTDFFYDQNGKEIRHLDVIKVLHFIGARRKKHYMYKWVKFDKDRGLCFHHLDESNELISLKAVCKKTDTAWQWHDAEIVQSNVNNR